MHISKWFNKHSKRRFSDAKTLMAFANMYFVNLVSGNYFEIQSLVLLEVQVFHRGRVTLPCNLTRGLLSLYSSTIVCEL